MLNEKQATIDALHEQIRKMSAAYTDVSVELLTPQKTLIQHQAQSIAALKQRVAD